MTIIKFPNRKPYSEPPFFSDIKEHGYHVYSLENAKKLNYYPPELPDYTGVALKNIKEDDMITIRLFFGIGKGENMRVDGGHIYLRVEFVDKNSVMESITTELPTELALSTGSLLRFFNRKYSTRLNQNDQSCNP